MINVAGIVFLIHYLDNFFFTNKDYQSCRANIAQLKLMWEYLGVPLAIDKLEGPSQVITYLGIEIDSREMTARLPSEKLTKLKLLLSQWSGKKKVTKRDLLSFIGFLSFACKVVKPGHMFLHRLIDLSTVVSSNNFFL